MHSKIDLAEFKKRLFENTTIGNPNIKGTPFTIFTFFDSSNKKFYGRIKDNHFEVTLNSTIKILPYLIKGFASSNKDLTTTVEYQIKPIWFGYLWIRIIPTVCILFLIILIVSRLELIFPLIVFGIIFIASFAINFYLINRRLKQFEFDFKKILEIQ